LKLPGFLACLAFSLLVSAAQAAPSYWRVVDVAADDTLNVRAGPSASSADIGDLDPGTAGLEITGTDASGKWGRMIWQEGDGWVAMRFLAPDPQSVIAGTDLPQGLLCGGTEPFWSLRLSGGSAAYSDITGAALAMGLTGAQSPEARGPFPAALSHSGAASGSLSIIEPAACSDGMSDRTYPWRILFMISTADGQRFMEGCCSLPLEAGSH